MAVLPVFEGLCRRRLCGVFGGGQGAALVAFGNWVGVGRLGSQHRLGVKLGIVFRLVAEAIRVRVIVPRALIIRDAVDNSYRTSGCSRPIRTSWVRSRGLIQIDNRLLSIGRVPKLPIRTHKKPISCLSA